VSLNRKHENDTLEGMKTELLKQFQDGVNTGNGDYRIAAAESAKAYGILIQTQLALESRAP
jgi:hypothetical protein